jgi:rRNA-processing protein FCF1
MDTLSQIDDFSFNRKIETRRLSERSTEFTNSFYQNTIQSKSLYKDISEDVNKLNKLQHLTHSKGGPTLVLFSNKKANILARMLDFLVESIDELTDLKGNDIAVLTPYIETLTFLQQNLKSKTKSRNYLIESVDRVQGLDVDYCLYVIPRSSSFSFNINRFNVATSRAKKCTYILAEQDYDHFVNLPNEVGNYLSKLKTEFSFSINANSGKDEVQVLDIFNSNNKDDILKPKIKESVKNHIISKASSSGFGLKITGKIDVSKFKKLKKEIKKNKENLYIIDTNVFVDFPEIITKIGKEYPVILSAKVIDELDNLKSTLNNDGKIKVQKALKSINRNIDKRDIRMEVADLSLLPIDFNKRSPDNLILTVALKFNTENPILLTSDNGLQVKAKGLKITTITLKEFLRR